MFQLFLIAFRNLIQHTRRTLLLGAAMAGVTMLLVTLLGLSAGMRSVMFRSATTLMTGHVNVAGFYKVTRSQSAPVVDDYKKVVDIVRREVPQLSYLTERGRGWGKLISDTGALQAGLGGVDIEKETNFREVIQIVHGDVADLAKPNTILIFEKQAEKLGQKKPIEPGADAPKRTPIKVGDTLTISAPTPRGVNNTIDVRVVAIARDVGLLSTFNVFVPTQTIRDLYQLSPESTGALHLYLKDVDDIPVVQQKLRDVLGKAGYTLMDDDPRAFWMKFEIANREDWTGQRLDITHWEAEVSFLKWVMTAIDSLTGALIFILLVIIAIGIMNTLWIAIRERTREIGTLRAIGMQRTRVLAMFIIEAFTLSVGATLLGALAGLGVCALLNAANVVIPYDLQMFLMSDTLFLEVQPRAVFGSIALISFCTTLISVIPSFLAARLKPVTAMHHLG